MKLLLRSAMSAGLLSWSSKGMVEGQMRGLQVPGAGGGPSLNVTAYGEVLTVDANTQAVYESSSLNANGAWVEFLEDGVSARLKGNMWRAFSLPKSIEVTEDTVLAVDFVLGQEARKQAVCLDSNRDRSSNEKKCVKLAGTDNWNNDFLNLPNQASLADPSRHFEVPIGHIFTGTMDYLAFVQHRDDNVTLGDSTFSNIAIKHVPRTALDIHVNNLLYKVPNYQLRYEGNQDDLDHIAIIDPTTPNKVSLDGNAWRAFLLPTPIQLNHTSMLEFDFYLEELGEISGICLDENDDHSSSENRCFVLARVPNQGNEMHKVLEPTYEGEENHYTIPVGHFFTGTINYIALMQDNDVGNQQAGYSTFSNIHIYDDTSRNPLKINVHGDEVTVPNQQLKYHSEDYREHVLEVSNEGTSVTLEGRMWRAMKLPSSVSVTEATVLEFDVTLEDDDLTSLAIGLDDDLNPSDKTTNFLLYGEKSNTKSFTYPEDIVQGETKHYVLPIGLDSSVRGDMDYLTFILKNTNAITGDDKTARKTGKAIFSNISIYNRPDFKLKMGNEPVSVTNYPLRYEGSQSDKYDILDVSSNGLSVTMYGNHWKAYEIPPYTITADSLLVFDFELVEQTDFHAICLDEDVDHDKNYKRCFVLSNIQSGLNDFYHVPEKLYPSMASPSSKKTFAIRVGHYYPGITINNIAFIQDNDTEDKTTGESTFSNVELGEATKCLLETAADFNLPMNECTFDGFFTAIEVELDSSSACTNSAWEEFVAYFGARHEDDVIDEVAHICTSAYEQKSIAFDQVTTEGYQFVEAFFDGDTTWNYQSDSLEDGKHGLSLQKDAARATAVQRKLTTANMGIEWPDMHNFHNCELRAAMCCWVGDRSKTTAADSLDSVADPIDNTDVCYVDFSRAQRSSHVNDGYSIYTGDEEGAVNCHGFAWGNDPGFAESALKGNTLLDVAMHDNIIGKGYVEEIPGAPMCACVEQMPVVTTADCTKLAVTKTLAVTYKAAISKFIVDVDITSIGTQSCGVDLSTYYQQLVDGGKATADDKLELDKILVGDGQCSSAISDFLATKGLQMV